MNVLVPRRTRARFCASIALLLASGAGLFPGAARAQHVGFPLVTSYSAADIGADAMGWIALQDRDGVMYFGCDALVRFDGERWRSTPVPGGYALRGLEFGRDGRLWAAANGAIGWFGRTDDGGWEFHSLASALPADTGPLGEVWHVFAEDHGAVFVTENKVLRWDGEKFRSWTLPVKRRLQAMRVGGKIYLNDRGIGLYTLGPGGPHLAIPGAQLPDAAIFWLEPRADGWLFATAGGLYVFANGKAAPFGPAISEFMQREQITCALRLPDGRLAIGTFKGGIALVRPDGTVDRILTEDDGLPTRAVFSLYLNRDNELWVTSNSHIFRLAVTSPPAIFDRRADLPEQQVNKIIRHDGRITLATDYGAYELLPDDRHFRPIPALRERLTDALEAPAGMIVTDMNSMRRFAAGTATRIHAAAHDLFVVQPARSKPGSYLVSEGRDILRIAPGDESTPVVRDLPDIGFSLAEDAGGRIWIGTANAGIWVADPAALALTAARVPPAMGLPATAGRSWTVGTPSGAIFVFSDAGGWMLAPGAERFRPIAGYPVRSLAAFSNIDAAGSLWIVLSGDGLPDCLGRIQIDGDRAVWRPYSVEGLSSVGTARCLFVENTDPATARVWVGAASGVVRETVRLDESPSAPRAPVLHAFARHTERDKYQPIGAPLAYSTHSVLFEFGEPEFARRKNLRLETHIDGVDLDWVAASPDSKRELTAVRDGRYVFRVRAVAETGAVSEASTFGFSIAPPWWRTKSALAGELVALVAGLFGGYRLRVQSLRRQNQALERKVRERTEELARASAAKTQFVANMSHDIRNPLNGIVGLALALEDSRLDARQSEIVSTLRECTTYLSTLVDDVLDFATIEAGRIELRPAPFVPVELLRSVAAALRAGLPVSGATLVVEAGPDLPAALLGDAGRIQQILVNYVTNALKYAGGTIRLCASVCTEDREEVEFAVADDGPGLSEAERAVLFTKFSRLAKVGGEDVGGTGLGLASCRLLADAMSGSVGVDSTPGHGARFYLRLPLAVAAPPADAPSAALPPATVLVVEDTDYNALAATAVLSKLGLASERARNGHEALRLFADRRFNIVLLDRNLPDMDGTEVARRIRELEADNPQAILLAVTAYCTAEDKALCLNAGMDAFVGKPLTPEKLRKVLIEAGRRLLSAASVLVPPEPQDEDIDLTLLGYISDGTARGLALQLERLLAALADARAQLARAAENRDFTALGDAAHLMLSHAKLVDRKPLEAAALHLEKTARARDATAFDEPFRRAQSEADAIMAALSCRLRAKQSV